MSAIDDLKDGVVLDTTTGDDGSENIVRDSSQGINIDTFSGEDEDTTNRVDLSKLNRNRKTVIKPKITTNRDTSARKTVNVADMVTNEVDPEDAPHISPILDIVDPENPNSLMSQYVKRKEEEAREWIAEKEEEKALLEEEAEIDIDLTSSNESLIIDEEVSSTNKTNIKLDDDIDISSIIDDEDKEIESMPPKDDEMGLVVEEPAEIDEGIDTEDAEPIDEVEEPEDDIFEDEATDIEEFEVAEDEAPIKKEEVEEYGAEDIEVAEDTTESFKVEIEEEEDTTTAVGTTDNDEVLKHLQKLATEKLKPVSKKLDISSFTVLKKPITNINPIFEDSSSRVVKWVLPAQESIVLMKEFSGSELEKLREYSENSRSVDSLNRRFKMIYDHIVSPKPATFEAWLKSTPYEDIDHYFFAIYVACFKGANYLPIDCPNKDCGEAFLTDDISIMDMVKFDTKDSKKLFTELYQSEATPAGKGVYCTEVVPMNDKIAIAFRQPSIYNVFEIASLDDRTRANYSAIIDYIPYIDTIYYINTEAKTLVPITYKMFPDNAQRTVRSKIQKYNSIFDTLSVDEFGPVKAYIRAIMEKTTGMRYVYPAAECPKCHSTSDEQRATAEELVFTRYQLGSLVTTSLS